METQLATDFLKQSLFYKIRKHVHCTVTVLVIIIETQQQASNKQQSSVHNQCQAHHNRLQITFGNYRRVVGWGRRPPLF